MPSTDLIRLITGASGALVVLIIGMALFLADKIVTAKTLARADQRAEDWKKLYEEERDAHKLDRESLIVANERAEAAVESARVTKLLLEEMRSAWDAPRSRRSRAVEQE